MENIVMIFSMVRLFGAHLGSDGTVQLIQINHTNRVFAPGFILIGPNMPRVNTHFLCFYLTTTGITLGLHWFH